MAQSVRIKLPVYGSDKDRADLTISKSDRGREKGGGGRPGGDN